MEKLFYSLLGAETFITMVQTIEAIKVFFFKDKFSNIKILYSWQNIIT